MNLLGVRIVDFALSLNVQFFELEDEQFEKYCHVYWRHSFGDLNVCPAIQSCLDRNRLNLRRMRIKPDKDYLFEGGVKTLRMRAFI